MVLLGDESVVDLGEYCSVLRGVQPWRGVESGGGITSSSGSEERCSDTLSAGAVVHWGSVCGEPLRRCATRALCPTRRRTAGCCLGCQSPCDVTDL